MKTKSVKYEVGPFRFTIRDDLVKWRYKVTTLSGEKITASGSCSVATTPLRYFLDGREPDGLMTFVQHHMSDLPGAIHHAERMTRMGKISVVRL